VPVDTLDDTSGSDTGTVTVDVDPNTSIEMLATSDGMQAQYGTSGNDLMTGDASRDFLLGSDGNDTLEGGANNDFLFGGQGSDWIEGDAGDDVILTFPVYDEAAVWQDMQQGGSAWGALMHNFDTNYTVSGSDTVYAGQGDDAMFFANGDDIHGQGGHDTYHLVDVDGATPAYIHGYQNGEQIDIYTDDLGADMTVKTQGNDTVIALNNTPVLIVKGTEGNFNSSAVTLQYDLLV
jgi:Ca2+-binding RTX toxin-like protein